MKKNDSTALIIITFAIVISALLLALSYNNEEKAPQKPKIVSVTRSMEVNV